MEAGTVGDDVRVQLAKQLQHGIKTHIGISTAIEINEPGVLARSEGKAKHVFDCRNA